MKRWFVVLFLVVLSQVLLSQEKTVVVNEKAHWVDSVYNALSLDEKIGQLFFVRANYPNQDYLSSIDTLIRDYNIGGVVFFGGHPLAQAKQTNRWNSIAKIPLFVSIDAEWGLGMRLANTVSYPLQMTLGAMTNDQLIYQMGRQVAEQCRRMGIHINFAPVVDVNSNPLNPVIGMRSFGEDPVLVSEKADLYMRGMQDGGIIACAKHFPGHGNTHIDSHADLPVINSSLRTIKNDDFLPFQFLIDQGVKSVMVAHVSVPILDAHPNRPATLSKPIVTDWLQDSLGFSGLIITDGLDMKGVTKYYEQGEVSLKALEAGNDILLIPDNVASSITQIKAALKEKPELMNQIRKSCLKILSAKYDMGLHKHQSVDTDNLLSDLNQMKYQMTVDGMMEKAITVVKEDLVLPLDTLTRMALLITGTTESTVFEQELLLSGSFDVFHLNHEASAKERKKLLTKLKFYPVVVVGVLNTNILSSKRYGIPPEEVSMLQTLAQQNSVVLDLFASPYALGLFSDPDKFSTILISYQEKSSMQKASAKRLLTGIGENGVLPVSTSGFPAGWGLGAESPKLYMATPEEVMAEPVFLAKVDSIALAGIAKGAYPGCQILAAKDGAVFYNKSFGFHTYDNMHPVHNTDVYDLASLTKILATTPALMRLAEDSLIDLRRPVSDYLLLLKNTRLDSVGFMEALAHQAGFRAWIPFYQSTFDGKTPDTTLYRNSISEQYPTRVAQNFYLKKGYEHVLIDSVINAPLRKKEYKYSGLAFYLFRVLTEQLSNSDFAAFAYQNWYDPMGLKSLRFNPREYFDLSEIIPTENDTLYRKQLLHGDVHDQGAAMLGGVSGNAGLFGNAGDVAAMMQMYLNGGTYGDKVFFNEETVAFFTSHHFEADSNRRGLGFDKPLLVYEDHMNNCKDASPGSFGHTGFTGTYAWADPENGLVYVFLSNRIHPNASNTKLMDMDIRTNIHQLFYEALKQKKITTKKQ